MVARLRKRQDSARSTASRPLVVGVTGHRDLVAGEVAGIERRVRNAIAGLAARFPGRPLRILSPLAEGADRLVALVAEDLGLELYVPLPLPEAPYAKDFESSRSWAEFGRLTRYAKEVTVLPLAPGNTLAAVADYGPARDRQYAEAGAWVAAHADVLIAVWDGKTTSELGGTGHVVEFRRHGTMPGYVPCFVERPTHDLVLHIACTRDRLHGEPADGLEPLSVRWLTRRKHATAEMPSHYVERLNEIAPLAAESSAASSAVIDRSYRFPLVIGVTGHRDLKVDEIPAIRERVRTLLEDLAQWYPHRKLRLLSPLAEGADRIVAEVALALDIEISVILPMPRNVYYSDFSSEQSIAEFNLLYRRASDVLTLPLARFNTAESILEPGPARDRQYAQAGVFLSAHC
ncbi:MAG TPA: hypothetical protein VFY03_00885, partial [Woeseiaceae bacterium]|nr:hypothetical protein [Woeseiaceae bacterium]